MFRAGSTGPFFFEQKYREKAAILTNLLQRFSYLYFLPVNHGKMGVEAN
ncbi:hypothetical protein BSM4216_0831 [Bacillus smithii]|jgi:hypothetical protein|nr:hypothetical protein BSM4216_0831 [Bacillus smithii]